MDITKKIILISSLFIIYASLPIDFITTYQEDEPGFILVDVKANEDNTFALGYVDQEKKTGVLGRIDVEEKNRNKGVGSQLFQCLISKMFELGCSRIEWEAIPNGDNEEKRKQVPFLIKFYEKNGGIIDRRWNTGASMYLTALK